MKALKGKPPKSFGFKDIIYEKSGYRATVTLNRPKVLNALNFSVLREMSAAFEDAAFDDDIAVVVVTGAGQKAFCTGADIKEWNDEILDDPNDLYKWMAAFIEMHERLRNIGKVTVARLNGMVVGGGNELNLSCDLSVAAHDVVLRHVGTSRGSVPAAGATQWLPIVVGERRAREMLLLGKSLTAAEAKEWGLVNFVVPRKKLDKEVDRVCEELYNKLPDCTRYTREQLNFWKNFSWSMTVGHLRDWLTVHTSAPEIQEGIKAFNERRSIDYKMLRELSKARAKKCPKCGKSCPPGNNYCGHCGRKM
ncbi:MAG TPA: enoyl-CoA hydratase-related protein [Candidatus Kryptonia bacterium]